MKRLGVLLLLLAGLALALTGCAEERYRVDYCGQKDAYRNARDAYPAGERVRLYYDSIATDTDYTFYLDDVSIPHSYEEGMGFVVEFTMPAHDVTLECVMQNSMDYEP